MQGARRAGELRCERFRGDANSPILLLNHWIDRFPPRPSDNARIGRAAFLSNRVKRCTRARGTGPGLIAVDFYETGSVIDVARNLNRRP